jgi:hypothetical protein
MSYRVPQSETDLDEALRCLIPLLADYAARPHPSKIRPLYEQYGRAVESTDAHERMDLLLNVGRSVFEGKCSCSGFLPFITCDPDSGIVSTAALELAQNSPDIGPDGLKGVRDVLNLATSFPEWPKAGILIGLSLLGDRRVYRLLNDCWRLMSKPELKQFTSAKMQFIYAAYIDFMIEALEQDRVAPDDWGCILGCLYRLPQCSDRIIDVRREFPLDPKREKQVHLIKTWTIPEYGAVIWKRLESLLPREQEPQLIPMVMKAWNIHHPDFAKADNMLTRWLRKQRR